MSEREQVLIEAYWKLRDHASQLRETSVYSHWVARTEDQTLSEEKRRDARNKVWALECRCRGLDDGCRDLAMLLGVDECEIERPVGPSEVTDGR